MGQGKDRPAEHTRTYTWQDPKPSVKALARMQGLEWLEGIARGEIPPPPVAALLGYSMQEVGPGRAVFQLPVEPWLFNPMGTVHGGMITTILDTATSCAVHTMLPKGQAYTTVELKVNFVNPVTAEVGLVRSIGEVLHVGKRIATAQGRIEDAQGKLYAHGSATCLIFKAGA